MADNGDDIDRAVALHSEAVAALEDGRVEAARSLAQQALDLFERESGPNHPDVANVLNCLATIHTQEADYRQAESCARRAVAVMRDVRTQAGGADIDRLYVQSLTGLGNALRTLGQYAEAAPLLADAAAIAETALGDTDEDLVAALNASGMLCKYDGRFDEGAAFYARAIRIAEDVNGPDHVSLASLWHNVGGLEHARGEYAKGEPAARRSVELRERALGPDHPTVAADVAALAALIDGQGRHDEAGEMYRRVLDIFERTYGPDHYELFDGYRRYVAMMHRGYEEMDCKVLYPAAGTNLIAEATFVGLITSTGKPLNSIERAKAYGWLL